MAFTGKPPVKTVDETREAQKQPGQDPVDPQSGGSGLTPEKANSRESGQVAGDPPLRNLPARKLRAASPVEEPSLPEDDA